MKNLNILTIIILCLVITSCQEEGDSNNLETTTDNTVNKVSDGYVLYSFMGDKTISLIDSTGNEIKSWTSEYRTSGGYYLSENKTLIRLGSTPDAATGIYSGGGAVGGIIEELDDNSNVIWSIRRDTESSTFHHDFKEIDENSIIALTWQLLNYNDNEYWNEKILIIDKASNSVIWEWDAIEDGGLIPQNNDKTDFLHFNSIDYRDGTILTSSRNQNKLYLIDKESKEITASISANGSLSGQHDASLLENGNILVFNNNAGNNKSEILELTKSDELIWQYSNDFYSDHISGVYRLESGNTIICSGVEARFIEITPQKEEVWDYTAISNNSNRVSEIFKIRKYSDY